MIWKWHGPKLTETSVKDADGLPIRTFQIRQRMMSGYGVVECVRRARNSYGVDISRRHGWAVDMKAAKALAEVWNADPVPLETCGRYEIVNGVWAGPYGDVCDHRCPENCTGEKP